METLQLSKTLRDEYVKKFKDKGEYGLYKYVVGNIFCQWAGTKSLNINPDIEILDMAEKFFSLSRTTGDKKYFSIGRALRKAAHKIYRTLKNIDSKKPNNARFLNVVGK